METLGKYEEDGYELTESRAAATGLNGFVATIQAKRYDHSTGDMEHNVILIVVNNKTQVETVIPIDAWNDITARSV